jgi:PTS system nitrogen regulatory IIA component
MPSEQMNEQQVAAYLHLDVREVAKLASRGQIPCRKVGGKFLFRKGEVDHWVETRMHGMDKDQLAGIERGVSAHHGFDDSAHLVTPLIPPEGLAVPLTARSRDGVIRDLVGLADKAGLVYAKDDLIRNILQREELCSTAMVPGVALPHPRHALPHDIASSFVIVGLAPSAIPFGAQDGSLTRLFFLICCKDDRTHLHVLARLGRLLQERRDIDRLLSAGTPEELRQTLTELEQEARRES